MDITTILNAHSEGALAHFSCLSLNEAVNYATQKGLKVEVIVIIDNPNEETIDFFKEQNYSWLSIHFVDYRDLGMSRNHGVNLAKGKYIAFLDADDLWSYNWIYDAFEYSEKHKSDVICHPEISFYFGNKTHFWPHVSSDSVLFNKWQLAKSNYWTSLIFVKKSVLLDIAQSKMDIKAGFGYEDWHWHCETIARGIDHVIIKNTAHFIRSKKDGLLSKTNDNNCVLPPTVLFDPDFSSNSNKDLSI